MKIADNERLKPNDEAIISALLATGSQREAGRRVKVSESTIRRKLKNPVFIEQYDQARRKVFLVSLGRLQYMTAQACSVIEELLSSKEPSSVRLSAARTILEYGVKWLELSDVETRLKVLEKKMEGK